jgi:hypothetical protein
MIFYLLSIIQEVRTETIDNNFIEDVADEPQTTLNAILEGVDTSSIIEVWKICRVGGLFRKDNLVVLFTDGTHICTCMEVITKGIICRHFWRVMLYSNEAKFHISIIPIRWYKDDILVELDDALKESPVLTAIETSTESTEVNFTLQSLRRFQGSCHKESTQQIIPRRNRFGIAFSTAKTAINIALETGCDNELVKLLKDFILAKQRRRDNIDIEDDISPEDHDRNESGNVNIIPLQQHLINQTTDPHVTKI